MTDPISYGKALYELACEDSIEDLVKDELSEISDVFEENPTLTKLLDCPGIDFTKRQDVINDCFSGVNRYILNVLYILTEKHSVHSFFSCVNAYNNQYDKEHGIEHVTAVTVIPLTEDEKKRLIHSLEIKRGTKISLENIIDPSILGGIILKFPDSLADASLKGRIRKAKYDLHKEKDYGY